MYLSKCRLRSTAIDHPGAWSLLGGDYQVHRSVWALFADSADRRRDFLYRVDAGPDGRPSVLTLSQREPSGPHALWEVESKWIEPQLQPADRLRFSVRLNPVVSRRSGDQRRGTRHDVVMDTKRRSGWKALDPLERPSEASLVHEAVEGWLEARSERHGFTLVNNSLLCEGYQVLTFGKGKGPPVRLGVCDVTGELTVHDVNAFLETWKHGLGAAKGFGCGLLQLRRVP